LACELPHELGIPLSRFSMSELKRAAVSRGIVASIGETTIWRWLSEDAIKPWNHRSWVFPRAPDFEAKAGRILDLYEGRWEGVPLGENDWVLCADEKTSIQARRRRHETLPPAPGRTMRLEHEYERRGALAYLAVWDVKQARVFGRCEATTGIEPFDRLVQQVMSRKPYCSAERVFWIVDNGSSHRGQASIDRLQGRWHNLVLVHTPVHASWLNQVEIYFSVLQRKVLTPNDFTSLHDVEDRILRFQRHYEQVARPFQWKFTRRDLEDLMRRLARYDAALRLAA
ncbi:MAG: IS630 family transposase, partial [Longimicrobiales bacterium]|nr:IS630 family transposase [Longimicrobiales bacterium]